MEIGRWNWQMLAYEPYKINPAWHVVLYSRDMNEIINCPDCGKELRYGDSYTSKELHTRFGLGYPVCEQSYEQERIREAEAKQ